MDLTIPLRAEEIAAARRRIENVALRTPLIRSEEGVALKLECLQPLGSYKIRGATNAIQARQERGEPIAAVVSASAGNFGQAIAAAARRLALPCVIHVPTNAARVKVMRLTELGAIVHEHPFDDWWRIMQTGETGDLGAFFHPVADRDVVAGAATIGAEIAEELAEPATLFAPIGGGGLMCGAAMGLRARHPGCRIVAVEVESATPLQAALAADGPVVVTRQASFIDGMGSTRILDAMWPMLRTLTDEVVVVTVAEVEAAVRALAFEHRVVAEGAGAAAFAAARKAGMPNPVAVVSGGNIDPSELLRILAA
ncbi:MAG: pyridoxal-phosphate dependent enzyme [Alphaproteobacteria bacterium]|nr:pyridoxal-phosphate dependent enzyme [Alphaproteobacteria bacterium]MBU1516632.1 pyridoxal-phosphate dependent enzyme [Alphaproteobacteria bacterium]MBU2094388.1 pyridoxal-phosphate dependent enzyme [Alphaproteobacteria bacterium]MBU2153273.1 pyridoxal-phosphate dependent enzyme [Alphaproteobacteria bacterium]MBU2307559.1 pyridoxal-phosphate dependent enzyme [Alphaproteobacteria bacterium]